MLHSPLKWNIIRLRITPKRVEQKDRVLITHLKKPAASISHQQSMSIVHGIPELKGKHSICISPREFVSKLCWGEPEPVKTIMGSVLIVDKGYTARLGDPALLGVVNGEHDGNGHIDEGAVVETERVEMKSLEELALSHEASQWASPAFAEDVEPLEVDFEELDSGQT
nr:Calmodulin-like protein 4 [Ipomoea batatas]